MQAALGVQVVDEAVFALAEKQPGFAKVFFYLEQEAMKPRYEIHSIGMPEVVGCAGSGAARPGGAGVVRGHGNERGQPVRDGGGAGGADGESGGVHGAVPGGAGTGRSRIRAR